MPFASNSSRVRRPQPRQPTSPRDFHIYVSIYAPTDRRDPCHWAIYIDERHGARSSIHQILVKRERGGYRVASIKYDTRPDGSRLWQENIAVGMLHASRVEEARRQIQNQRVDNRSTTWNCQSWVLEALSALHDTRLATLSSEGMRRLQRQQQFWQ